MESRPHNHEKYLRKQIANKRVNTIQESTHADREWLYLALQNSDLSLTDIKDMQEEVLKRTIKLNDYLAESLAATAKDKARNPEHIPHPAVISFRDRDQQDILALTRFNDVLKSLTRKILQSPKKNPSLLYHNNERYMREMMASIRVASYEDRTDGPHAFLYILLKEAIRDNNLTHEDCDDMRNEITKRMQKGNKNLVLLAKTLNEFLRTPHSPDSEIRMTKFFSDTMDVQHKKLTILTELNSKITEYMQYKQNKHNAWTMPG